MGPQFVPNTSSAIEYIPLTGQVPAWLIALLFLVVVLFAWIRIYQPKRIKLLFNSFMSNQHAGELSREERQSSGLGNPVFEVIYFFGSSLMIHFCVQFYKPDLFGLSPGETYLILTAGILVFVLVKNLMIHLLSWIFDLKELFADILFFRFVSHALLGILLIPILLLITFPPDSSFSSSGLGLH
ncbi:DUF4271 domain-containing protein [bacterium SCSIO 12741]|nr:DUF4271 domain-containing protein [bacterium SCSIO 12741]